MNIWFVFAILLLLCLIPCGIVSLRGAVMERVLALQVTQIIMVFTMLLIVEGLHRPILLDVALTLAVITFTSSLAFTRFLERWL